MQRQHPGLYVSANCYNPGDAAPKSERKIMSSYLESKFQEINAELSADLHDATRQYFITLQELKVNSFEALLNVAEDENYNVEVRSIACWVLGKIRDKRAVGALLKAFKDQDTHLYWEAAKALGFVGSKRAVRPLAASLLESDSSYRRAAAAHALGLIGDKRSLEPLLQVLLNPHEDSKTRGEAAEALANLNDPRAVDPLIKALQDESTEVRFWSAYALGEIGDERAVPELKRLAATDEAIVPEWGKISSEAANAIEQIHSRD